MMATRTAQHVEAATEDTPPRVSVLIVNFNGAAVLDQCLASLARVSEPSHEVVVVDNGSSDNSLDVVARYPDVRIVRSPCNLGFAGGNNLGLPHCRGRFILLLNNDTTVPEGVLTTLADYLDAHPQVGVVQAKMILPRYGSSLDVCGSFLTWCGLPYHYGYFKKDCEKYRSSYPVFSGKGACLMFRREIVERAGGFLFDPDFFCYYEETDFCHRVWLAGYEVHFVPTQPVQHFMGATAGSPHGAFALTFYLRNMAFSLLSNLSLGGLFRIAPCFFAVLVVGLIVSAVALRKPAVLAHAGALLCPLRCMSRIRQRRKLVKQIRRRSDRQIFATVLRNPRPSYYLRTFTATLAGYEDAPLALPPTV